METNGLCCVEENNIYRSGNKSLLLRHLNKLLYPFLNTFDLFEPELICILQKTQDLNGCPLFRMTLAYEFTMPSLSLSAVGTVACRQLSAPKGLFNRPPYNKHRIKNIVTLNAVYCICVDAAVLHVLTYVFELLRLALLINCVKYFG
jgi:hypothetical protein